MLPDLLNGTGDSLVCFMETHERSLSNSIATAALKELDGRGKRMKGMPVFPSVRTGESLQGSRGWLPAG